jgi:glycosyltransferase involved in cell wall biosynthesis
VTRVLLDARKARDFGIGTHILGLLGALAERHRFDLSAVMRREDVELLPENVAAVVSNAPHYSVTELVSVGNAIRRVAPDIFHAPHYVVPLFPPRATVVTIHDLMHLQRPEHASIAKRIYARWMMGRAVRSSARVIAVSEATRGDLVREFPSAAAKVTVIPNGVGAPFFESESGGDRAARERYGLAERYVLFLGNDKPHKNLAGLLDAMALLKNSSPSKQPPVVPSPVSLVLAGGAADRAPQRAREIAARGLTGNVKDLGVVPDDDVPALLRGAAALVLPSFAEGFGIPVLEAQAVGTPVVCSDRGGLREAAGDAAIYIDPERPESIAHGIEKVLGDQKTRERICLEGKRRTKEFTWDAVAEKTEAVYRAVLEISSKGK